MTLTPYQTKIYFDAFHIPVQEVVFQDTTFYYEINENEMKLYYTLLDSSHLTQDFIEYCFREFHVKKITVKACFCDQAFSLKRTTKVETLDDNILMLYEYKDIDQYSKELGKKTRQHLRYYRRKFDAYVQGEKAVLEKKILLQGDEIESWEKVCGKIYELNEERCNTKGFHSGTPKEWITICNKTGGVVYYTYNSEVIAGTIFATIENEVFLYMIAHDNFFNEFNIGNLILQDTIEFAFENNIKKFHFLWGACDYKKRFKAINYPLYDLTIYHSQIAYAYGEMCLIPSKLYRVLRQKIKTALIKIVGKQKFEHMVKMFTKKLE